MSPRLECWREEVSRFALFGLPAALGMWQGNLTALRNERMERLGNPLAQGKELSVVVDTCLAKVLDRARDIQEVRNFSSLDVDLGSLGQEGQSRARHVFSPVVAGLTLCFVESLKLPQLLVRNVVPRKGVTGCRHC